MLQELIGKDGLDLLKLYLAPIRTFWKGVPEDSQVSRILLCDTLSTGMQIEYYNIIVNHWFLLFCQLESNGTKRVI
jgi:hypothetical protein